MYNTIYFKLLQLLLKTVVFISNQEYCEEADKENVPKFKWSKMSSSKSWSSVISLCSPLTGILFVHTYLEPWYENRQNPSNGLGGVTLKRNMNRQTDRLRESYIDSYIPPSLETHSWLRFILPLKHSQLSASEDDVPPPQNFVCKGYHS